MMNQPEAKTADMKLDESNPETSPQTGVSGVLIDPELERPVKRKIDAIVLPLVSHLALFTISGERGADSERYEDVPGILFSM